MSGPTPIPPTSSAEPELRRAARWRLVATAGLLGAAVLGLVAHMRRFAFVTDDAFISFVYARNLAEHGELVFNLGERVEGYTNFLWTLWLAGWMKLGWPPESASVFWGTSAAAATLGVCAWLMIRLGPQAAGAAREEAGRRAVSPWAAVPALCLAALPGYACWSSGGLETQLFTLLVTLGSALYLGQSGAPGPAVGGVMGLAALTRPEGNLFLALLVLHRVLGKLRARALRPTRRELLCVLAYLALVAPHFVWRRAYYGWWLPNTFYIKSSGGSALGVWQRGGYYLGRVLEDHVLWAPLLLGALGFLLVPATRRALGYVALVTAVFALYIASVGGDFMGLYRFALPVVPLLFVGGALGLRALAGRLRLGRAMQAALVTALLGLHLGHADRVDRRALVIGSDRGIDSPGYLRWYTADRAAIGRWMGRYAQPDDYAAVGGAGAQVYYSRMRSLDCFGLSDAYIAHHVPPVSDRPGHQKYAPLEYQLERRPTIITSNYYRIGPRPRCCPPVVDEAAWRARGYHYVSVEIPGLSSPWYTFLKRMDRSFGPLGPVTGDID